MSVNEIFGNNVLMMMLKVTKKQSVTLCMYKKKIGKCK